MSRVHTGGDYAYRGKLQTRDCRETLSSTSESLPIQGEEISNALMKGQPPA